MPDDGARFDVASCIARPILGLRDTELICLHSRTTVSVGGCANPFDALHELSKACGCGAEIHRLERGTRTEFAKRLATGLVMRLRGDRPD